MSMQVDRVDRQRIYWTGNYVNPNSVEYRLLEDEANQAVILTYIHTMVYYIDM